MITRQIKTMSWEKPYVSPEIKELEIKSEGMLCVSGSFYTLGGGGEYTDEFINDNGEY